MAPKNLKIDQLKLDLLNPRIRNAANQHEAMQQIIDEQDHKLANLAEHIVDNNSLNPMDRLLVLKDPDGKYVVLEGNRRALALKLLSNPAASAAFRYVRRFKSGSRRSLRDSTKQTSSRSPAMRLRRARKERRGSSCATKAKTKVGA